MALTNMQNPGFEALNPRPIMSPIIKQIQNKVDELRDTNAASEAARVKHEQIIAASQKVIETHELKEKELIDRAAVLEVREKDLAEKFATTEVRLGQSIDSLTQGLNAKTVEVAKAQEEFFIVTENLAKAQDDLNRTTVDFESKKLAHEQLNQDLEDTKAKLAGAKTEFETVNESIYHQNLTLEVMAEEERAAHGRKADLQIREARVAQFEKDNNINT